MAEISPGRGYESKDASAAALAWALVFTGLALVLAVLLCLGILGALRATQAPPGAVAPPFQQVRPLPPPPRLQPEPLTDMDQLREEQQKQLNSYGWVNREQGIAHIPIDQAARLLLRKGLPVREGKPSGETAAAGKRRGP